MSDTERLAALLISVGCGSGEIHTNPDELARWLVRAGVRPPGEPGLREALDGAVVHPDDGYGYDGCNGPGCRAARGRMP